MESQSKTIAAVAELAAKERLETSLHRHLWNRFPRVRDPELEFVTFRFCPDAHWLVPRSMGESVADQIRRQLSIRIRSQLTGSVISKPVSIRR
jgi:hypothetical protein